MCLLGTNIHLFDKLVCHKQDVCLNKIFYLMKNIYRDLNIFTGDQSVVICCPNWPFFECFQSLHLIIKPYFNLLKYTTTFLGMNYPELGDELSKKWGRVVWNRENLTWGQVAIVLGTAVLRRKNPVVKGTSIWKRKFIFAKAKCIFIINW